MCYFSVIWFVSGTLCEKTGFSNPAAPAAHLWRAESVLIGDVIGGECRVGDCALERQLEGGGGVEQRL